MVVKSGSNTCLNVILITDLNQAKKFCKVSFFKNPSPFPESQLVALKAKFCYSEDVNKNPI